MRIVIFMTLIATILVSVFFFAIRDDTVVLKEASEAQPRQRLAMPHVDAQPEHGPLSDTEPDSQIPDDEMIVINWYEPQHRKFAFPDGSPLENFEYYKLAAESGYGIAAYQLANMMDSCRHAYLTREELDEAIVKMRQTSTYYDPKYERIVRIGEPDLVEEHVSSSVARFESCKDFTVDQREESEMWMELAANNGHTTAMLDYGRQLADPQLSLDLYRSAWELGDADALLSLAEGLEKVFDQGMDPNAKVPAYVALHAYVTVLRTTHGSDAERVAGRWTLTNQARLDEMARELLPHELEAAAEQSRRMIVENRNCCYSM